MFALGGNAFDAAIASLCAAFVVEPTLTSAGGSGFLLAHPRAQPPMLFDFFSQTPRTKRPSNELDFYPVELNFGGEVQTFHIGMGAIAVPGNLAGAFTVQQRLGKLPFKEVVQPAIDYAKNGFEITSYQEFCLRLLEPIMLAQPESRKIFAPQGKLLTAGEVCTMRNFADTLTFLAQHGVEEFYQGEIAHRFVKDSQAGGGYLTLADLSNYRVIVRKPLQTHYRGYKLLTNPPPSAGGTLIALALKLLSAVNFTHIEFGSPRHLQILAQVMRLTNEARHNGYDASLDREDSAERFLSQSDPYQHRLKNFVNKWGSTTHISVIDSEGNAASTTTTNGEGSAYIIPDTGIMVNNMLGEADINPFGFHNWMCDRRIASMMAPTLLLKQGKSAVVLGSGGSNRIRTAILQVISNLVDFELSLDEAVQSPRVHWENNVLSVEPNRYQEAMAIADDTKLVLWPEKNMFFGGVHAVRGKKDGMEGAGDARRDGIAILS